jgi:hyperosmotically inducible periplasmic protein
MKNSLKVIPVMVLGVSLGFLALTGGCASTPTKESTGQYVDDTSITAKVKAAFVKDKVVSAMDVKVETFKGVVQLSGFVDTVAEKDQAALVASGIAGVTEVKNNITVK